MEQSLSRCRDILFCSEFKKAMWELCKNKGLSFAQAEKSMGFKDGFIESVEKGIYKLTLEDVRKIAGYFHTTMDSVLDGGKWSVEYIHVVSMNSAIDSLRSALKLMQNY